MASGKIPTKTFVVTKACGNTAALKNGIIAELGIKSFIAVSKRDISTFEYNGIYSIVWIQAEKAGSLSMNSGIRYRNGWGFANVATNYDASIPVGDEYTVYVLDEIDI